MGDGKDLNRFIYHQLVEPLSHFLYSPLQFGRKALWRCASARAMVLMAILDAYSTCMIYKKSIEHTDLFSTPSKHCQIRRA
jgi:hypothetical protein